ncbi:MarR family winged helix-turn-helix transcriptional regulator [Amycolatopsis sp. FDAARGOS 1241]|uniref:MarR family winged helix-turn-helix transcriptional regulator n=1 Tax=Amycolatopsis sp. FDAARGOS 1241 TaxID=2778070 RepID=UPI0019507B76|nr:MarR family transcriptional regulator [Amycolatopsis sp. FDAARGOS 1241]QRP45817.1 MarR family transcriptional regulator [Amycolatopsis sp. FDAARGOS 1241]
MSDEQAVRWLTGVERDAWQAYIVASLRLRQRLHRELTDGHGVSLADYELLVCLNLSADKRVRMSELAYQLGSTKSRLSHQVSKLELTGLVRRCPDADDKRGVITELTQAGQQLLDEAAPTHLRGAREHLIDLLSPEEQAVVGAAFGRVLEHLDDLDNRRDTLTDREAWQSGRMQTP